MPRLLSVALIAAILAACAVAQEKAPGSAGLRGVWKITELSSREIGGQWKTLPIHSSVYIFTDKHYSYMFAPGTGPRRLYAGDPNKPTAAERVSI
jgi:hypothetical protein